jgi:hypothetical protein
MAHFTDAIKTAGCTARMTLLRALPAAATRAMHHSRYREVRVIRADLRVVECGGKCTKRPSFVHWSAVIFTIASWPSPLCRDFSFTTRNVATRDRRQSGPMKREIASIGRFRGFSPRTTMRSAVMMRLGRHRMLHSLGLES